MRYSQSACVTFTPTHTDVSVRGDTRRSPHVSSRPPELLVILISVAEIGPRSRDQTEIRPRSGCQIWSKLADLLVGRRSSACNGYVTDPSSHDECVHRTQKHRKPLSETLRHARRARHRTVARHQPHLALRPAPPRRPPHTKRWFRALAVIASGPGHPPRSTVTTRKTRRLACYVFLHGALLLINSAPISNIN